MEHTITSYVRGEDEEEDENAEDEEEELPPLLSSLSLSLSTSLSSVSAGPSGRAVSPASEKKSRSSILGCRASKSMARTSSPRVLKSSALIAPTSRTRGNRDEEDEEENEEEDSLTPIAAPFPVGSHTGGRKS